MKKWIATAALTLILTACAGTDASNNSMQGGMMQSDKMKDGKMQCQCPCCQKMMEGGMMKGDMPMDMQQCQKMMQNASPQPSSEPPVKKSAVSAKDHKKHHPAQ